MPLVYIDFCKEYVCLVSFYSTFCFEINIQYFKQHNEVSEGVQTGLSYLNALI